MITPMSRLTVVGPRRLRREVVEGVQDLGVLHVDHARPGDQSIAPRELDAEDQATRTAVEALDSERAASLAH